MGLVIKLAVLFVCIKYLLRTERPGITAAIYATTFFAIAVFIGLVQQFTLGYGVSIAVSLVYDLITGFIFFWLLNQYQDDLILFYTIIVGGIVANLAIKFLLLQVFY